MRIPKALAIMFCVGVFLLSATLKADEWDKTTIITFSGPVMVDKTPLPAGTYVFRLADTANRDTVQIFNKDMSHMYATILAIPDYRIQPTGETAIKFSETNEGSELAGTLPDSGIPIKEWFYPGNNFGQEFKVVPQPVVAEAQPGPVVEQPAPEPQPAAPVAAPAPEPQTAAPAAPAPTEGPAAPAPAQQSAPEQLPQTASSLPLLGLIGVLSLAAAASLRILLRVSA